ncbi:hypothetical protein ACFY1E_20045, partial [Streptomyces sp. NPDC001604]
MTPGPADEARRALREARQRERSGTGGPGQGSTAGREPAAERDADQEPATQKPPGQEQASQGSEARPADAARAALRRVAPGPLPDAAASSGTPGTDAAASAEREA